MSDDFAATMPLIWANPAASNNEPTLVWLMPGLLTMATIPRADVDGVIARLNEGQEVPGQAIPLASLVEARGEENKAQLTITFQTSPSKQESRTITFVDQITRGEFISTLVEVLGPGWQERRERMSRWKAGFWTLGPTVVVALVTWFMYLEAVRIAQGNPPVNWGQRGRLRLLALISHWLEQQLGPTGILISGGLIVGTGLVFFVLVMAEPPIHLVVEPTHPA